MISHSKFIGVTVSAFGLGILTAFFLPECVLVVLEALVIIVAGFFFIKC